MRCDSHNPSPALTSQDCSEIGRNADADLICDAPAQCLLATPTVLVWRRATYERAMTQRLKGDVAQVPSVWHNPSVVMASSCHAVPVTPNGRHLGSR